MANQKQTGGGWLSYAGSMFLAFIFFQVLRAANAGSLSLMGLLIVILPLVLIAWVIVAIGNARARRRNKAIQIDRDEKAGQAVVPDAKLSAKGVVLFLRPFAMKRRLLVRPRKNFWQHSTAFTQNVAYSEVVSLDEFLANCFSQYPFVAADDARDGDEAYGPGRVLMPQGTWREQIEYLMRESSAIVIVPSYHDGTLWELARIKSLGLQRKTFIVVPHEEQKGLKDWWSQTTQAVEQQLQLRLPPLKKAGLYAWDGKAALRLLFDRLHYPEPRMVLETVAHFTGLKRP